MNNCEDLHRESMKNTTDKTKIYNNWATSYDSYVKSLNYVGPKEIVKKMCDYTKKFQYLKILDFGCGTGLVGEEILKQFKIDTFIDGIDISENMISKAKEKNIYDNIFNIDIQKDDFDTKSLDKYDIIISSGVFLEGHVKFQTIDKLLDILKPNGYIFITIRDSYKNTVIESESESNLENEDKISFYKYFESVDKKAKGAHIESINYLDGVNCSSVVIIK